MENNLTFGPVLSRRFGVSLGIDLSPNQKQCNFDCLYCELKGSKTTTIQKNPIKPSYYIEAIKEALKKYDNIDVLTLTANGEPTLYPYLSELIDQLNSIKGDKKLLILSNSSLIYKKEIQESLKKLDIVKLSVDCISKECFKKLDRLDSSIDSDDILRGLEEFSQEFKNELILEILFVDTLNNKKDEIEKLVSFCSKIKPNRIDIGTIDRPPAYEVKPISYNELLEIANMFDGQNISIAHREKIKLNRSFSKDEILNLLDKRPQTQDDIDNLLDEESKKIFDKLISDNIIKTVNISGLEFYRV